MTKNKKSILTVVAFGVLSLIVLVSNISTSLEVQAQSSGRQDQVSSEEFDVPADREEPITLIFSYGSVTTDIDIRNPEALITIDGEGLELVDTSFEDWFNGNPNRGDLEEIPAEPACNTSYTGQKYQISPSLVSAKSARYGLQSAYNNTGGAATTERLRVKHTGCIKFEVQATAEAQVGEEVKVIFDEDAGNNGAGSQDYQANRRPPRQIVIFNITEAQNIAPEPTETPLTTSDIPGLTVNCTSAEVNTSTTCTFTLPAGKTLPPDFKLGIGNSVPGGTCTVSGQTVTCTNVPTGTQVGSQDVFGQIGSEPKADTGEDVTITSAPAPASQAPASQVPASSASSVVDNTPRTGGIAIASILTASAAGIVGYIGYKTRSKKITKVDLINPDTKKQGKGKI